jgi:hypothetical protein
LRFELRLRTCSYRQAHSVTAFCRCCIFPLRVEIADAECCAEAVAAGCRCLGFVFPAWCAYRQCCALGWVKLVSCRPCRNILVGLTLVPELCQQPSPYLSSTVRLTCASSILSLGTGHARLLLGADDGIRAQTVGKLKAVASRRRSSGLRGFGLVLCR